MLQADPEGVAVRLAGLGDRGGCACRARASRSLPIALGVVAATIVSNVMTGKPIPLAGAFRAVQCRRVPARSRLIERFFGPAFNLDGCGALSALSRLPLQRWRRALVAAAMVIHAHWPANSVIMSTAAVWFLSDTLGLVTVAPLLISAPSFFRSRRSASEKAEGVLQLVVVTGIFLYLFAPLPESLRWVQIAPGSVLFPIILWIGARSHPAVAAAALFIAATMLVGAVVVGFGRLGDVAISVHDRVYQAQLLMAGFAFAVLALTSLFAERRAREESLADSEHRLRLSNQAGGIGTFTIDVEEGVAHYSPDLATMTGFPGVRSATIGQAFARVHRDDVAVPTSERSIWRRWFRLAMATSMSRSGM